MAPHGGGVDSPPPVDHNSTVVDNISSVLQWIIHGYETSTNLDDTLIAAMPETLLKELKNAVESGHLQINTHDKYILPHFLRQAAVTILEKRNCVVNYYNQDMNNERYRSTDQGPYAVYIESKEKNISGLSDIKIGKLFYEGNVPGIKSIEKRGRNRLAVEFNSFNNANTFLNSNIDSINNWKAYIPSHLISNKVVIRNIDKEISEEDIKKNLRTDDDREVLSIRRIKRRRILQPNQDVEKSDHQPQFDNTNSIVAVFRGSTPPKIVKLFFNIRYPEIYISPVIQCHRCCRYGHTSKICKAKVRCPACSLEHNLLECPDKLNPKCLHCKGSHLSNEKGVPIAERSCEEFFKQKKIKHVMAIYNISIFEAMREISGSKAAVINRVRDEREYPTLPNHDSAYDKIPLQITNYKNAVQSSTKKNFTFTKSISQRSNINTPKRRQAVPAELLFYHDGRLPESRTKRICSTEYDSSIFDNSPPEQSMGTSMEESNANNMPYRQPTSNNVDNNTEQATMNTVPDHNPNHYPGKYIKHNAMEL